MTETNRSITDLKKGAGWRIAWTVTSFALVEILACGLSAIPAVTVWSILSRIVGESEGLRLVVFSVAIVPSYVLSAIVLLLISPLLTRLADGIHQMMWKCALLM